MGMINLLKYGILGKKKYYLTLFLSTIGVYIILFMGHYYFKNISPEFAFAISFLFMLVSLILNIIFNIMSLNTEDIRYLYYSVPINPKYIYLRRMLMGLFETFFIFLLNMLFMTMIIQFLNPIFKDQLINYLQRGGIFTLLIFVLAMEWIIIICSTFVIASNLPSEKDILRDLLNVMTILYLLFNNALRSMLSRIFPYNISLHMPQFNYEDIVTSSLRYNINLPKINVNIASTIFYILTFIFFLVLNSYLFEKYIEIK